MTGCTLGRTSKLWQDGCRRSPRMQAVKLSPYQSSAVYIVVTIWPPEPNARCSSVDTRKPIGEVYSWTPYAELCGSRLPPIPASQIEDSCLNIRDLRS